MRAAAIRSIGQSASPEGLNVLADALRESQGEVWSAAIIALPTVVAALTPEWYGRMPAGTTRDVCRTLQCTSLPNRTRLLLVQALEIVGDGSGVREIEVMLADKQPLYADRDGIKERLRALLPLLRERLRLEQDDALLLRGSQQTATSQEQLLRAAAPQATLPPPEQLLRAVEGRDNAS